MLTNNGEFINAGTFCTSLNFTNNSNFNNNAGLTLNTGNLVFNHSGDRTKVIFNRGGNIINLGTYTGMGTVLGNPVQTSLPCSPSS